MYLLGYIHKLFYFEVSPISFDYDLAIIREMQCMGLYIIHPCIILQYIVHGDIYEYV